MAGWHDKCFRRRKGIFSTFLVYIGGFILHKSEGMVPGSMLLKPSPVHSTTCSRLVHLRERGEHAYPLQLLTMSSKGLGIPFRLPAQGKEIKEAVDDDCAGSSSSGDVLLDESSTSPASSSIGEASPSSRRRGRQAAPGGPAATMPKIKTTRTRYEVVKVFCDDLRLWLDLILRVLGCAAVRGQFDPCSGFPF